TTLQMRADVGRADRAAFDRYWDSMLGDLSFDDEVRTYLLNYVVELAAWRRSVRVAFGRANRFFTTGFLPQQFRDELGLPWSPRKQRVFEIVMRTIGRLLEVLPDTWRAQPFERYLDDMRERRSQGKNLI
ncbi:oxygenase MpaB family protein, partial [Nocardia sp. NPDC060220]|uniref:oxygenase MpaB family protein n=1 Tax=Nocardia sp. NPDC060220 TaxID=3347076 RepID=UPI003653E332